MPYPANGVLPQSASIVSRWRLDEASGSRADAVGSNTLTDNNTVAAGTGYTRGSTTFDNSADFEGTTSEFLSITDAAQSGLDLTSNFTFAVYVKIESTPASNSSYGLFNKYNATGNQRGYAWHYRNDAGTNKIFVDLSTNGIAVVSKSVTKTLTTGTWFHIALVYTAAAGTADFYTDGVQEGAQQTGLPTSVFNNNVTFVMGSEVAGAGNFFDGLMQDGIIWNVALTSSEITSLYDVYSTLGLASSYGILTGIGK